MVVGPRSIQQGSEEVDNDISRLLPWNGGVYLGNALLYLKGVIFSSVGGPTLVFFRMHYTKI